MSAPALQGDGAALVPPAERRPVEHHEHDTFAAALAAFQAELPTVTKGATGQVAGRKDYKYADLADVSVAVLPVLARHGLSFSSRPTLTEAGRFVLIYALRHTSGSTEEGIWPLPDSTNQQALGSAITYARRYALCAVTGVAPEAEDDDGQAAAPRRDRAPARDEQDGDRDAPPTDQAPAEPSPRALNIAAAGLARRLLEADRAGLKAMWDEVRKSPAAEVDVSGLVDATQRDVFGVSSEQPITVLGLRGLIASHLAAQQQATEQPAPADDPGEIM